MIVVLAGGVGAARFLSGLIQVVPRQDIVAIVNTGDDVDLHGLHISPDLDTVTYTLAGAINPETGWGLAGETWAAMGAMARYGAVRPTDSSAANNWFNLGDQDLATHMYRTHRLAEAATLTEVTAEIADAWELGINLLPMSDDRIETRVTTSDGEIGFQEYFVGRRHGVPVNAVRFVGVESARPGPAVLDAIGSAEVVVIAPSNPIVSIGPILAIPGVADAVRSTRARCVAISPIIAGAALKGPADRMLVELGHEASVVGVARLYCDLARTLVIDTADEANAELVRAAGMDVVVTATIMRSPQVAASLASVVIAAGSAPAGSDGAGSHS